MAASSISRSDLYRQVWQTPMMRLARTYGMSDVGLAKVCQRYNIPRPARGYWAKKQHGQPVRRAPLPQPDYDPMIGLSGGPPRPQLPKDVADMLARERDPANRITLDDSAAARHPLVAAATAELETVPIDERGLLVAPAAIGLSLTLSPGILQRALHIVDALLTTFEARGCKVGRGPAISIMGERVSIDVSEQLSTTRHPWEEFDFEGRYTFYHSRFIERQSPAGRLTLRATDHVGRRGAGDQSLWRETAESTLDDRLNQVIAGVIRLAARARQRKKNTAGGV